MYMDRTLAHKLLFNYIFLCISHIFSNNLQPLAVLITGMLQPPKNKGKYEIGVQMRYLCSGWSCD